MCGIAGSISLGGQGRPPEQQAAVQAMLRKMQYRGPDEARTLALDRAVLGTCRLSIVDPEHGGQPMRSNTSPWTVVFNGEIYNHRELRTMFARNYAFATNSDTEIILHLFEEFGVQSFQMMNGMFAFCITDGHDTYIVRDRLGIKPLYYRVTPHSLLFASEAKCLVDGAAKIAIEPTYSEFETNVGYETPFSGIFKLPPGSYLRVHGATGAYTLHSYYSLDGWPVKEIEDQEAIEQFRWLMLDSIRMRTEDIDPYGAFVSGGLDSSIIALNAAPSWLFSLIVNEKEYMDESKYIDTLNQQVQTDIVRIKPHIDDFALHFVEMVYCLDFPTTTLAAFTQFLLSKEAKRHNIRVMLSGLGADEYLGGYVRHVSLFKDNYQYLVQNHATYADMFVKVLNNPAHTSNPELYYHILNRSSRSSSEGLRFVNDLCKKQQSLVNQLSSTDLAISFPPLLRMDDRINMYFSIESRAPFLDYRLVEFAYSLPDHLKIRATEDGRVITKYILRKAFEHSMPHNIVYRRDKVGFPSPVAIWLNQYLHHAVVTAYQIVSDVPELAALFSQHDLSNANEFSRKKWQLVQWAAWYLLFIENLSVDRVTNLLFSRGQHV